jgi:hypothetical protein
VSETKFTKGPWVIGYENNQCCEVVIGGEDNVCVYLDRQDNNTSKVVISREEMLANAHLIVAAPALYEALEAVAESLQLSGECLGVCGYGDKDRKADATSEMWGGSTALEQARAALAAARGVRAKAESDGSC